VCGITLCYFEHSFANYPVIFTYDDTRLELFTDFFLLSKVICIVNINSVPVNALSVLLLVIHRLKPNQITLVHNFHFTCIFAHLTQCITE
jgi:hypothetical protein